MMDFKVQPLDQPSPSHRFLRVMTLIETVRIVRSSWLKERELDFYLETTRPNLSGGY